MWGMSLFSFSDTRRMLNYAQRSFDCNLWKFFQCDSSCEQRSTRGRYSVTFITYKLLDSWFNFSFLDTRLTFAQVIACSWKIVVLSLRSQAAISAPRIFYARGYKCPSSAYLVYPRIEYSNTVWIICCFQRQYHGWYTCNHKCRLPHITQMIAASNSVHHLWGLSPRFSFRGP